MTNNYTYEYLTIDLTNITIPSLTTEDIFTLDPVNIQSIDISWTDEYQTEKEWKEILAVSKNNVALAKAIERVKILYYLSTENDQT